MNSTAKEILEWIYCIIIALALAMIVRYFIGTPTIVKQVSMKPTLIENERLWLNRWGRTTKTLPKRGEIITFEEPAKISFSQSEINMESPVAKYDEISGFGWFFNNFLEIGKRSYIKRVIGLPGEEVVYTDNVLYINGKKVKDNYGCKPTSDFSVKVPEGRYFVLGDNRDNSLDSRYFGSFLEKDILGKTSLTIFPFNRIGKKK